MLGMRYHEKIKKNKPVLTVRRAKPPSTLSPQLKVESWAFLSIAKSKITPQSPTALQESEPQCDRIPYSVLSCPTHHRSTARASAAWGQGQGLEMLSHQKKNSPQNKEAVVFKRFEEVRIRSHPEAQVYRNRGRNKSPLMANFYFLSCRGW